MNPKDEKNLRAAESTMIKAMTKTHETYQDGMKCLDDDNYFWKAVTPILIDESIRLNYLHKLEVIVQYLEEGLDILPIFSAG